jgi:hypothetical protein
VRAVGVRLGLLLLLAAGTATATDPPVQDLADGRTGKIYFESVTPSGFLQLAKGQATRRPYPAASTASGSNRRASM